MPRFVRGNLRFVLQSEPNIVQSIQQAVAHEFVDGNFARKP